jgi:hypothetical protein
MNVSSEQQVVEEAAVRALRATRAKDAESAPARHSQQTPQCPHVTRFAAVMKFGGTWTPEESAHIAAGCPFCEKVRRMFAAAMVPTIDQEETVTNLNTTTGEETVTELGPAKPAKPPKKGAPPGDKPKT